MPPKHSPRQPGVLPATPPPRSLVPSDGSSGGRGSRTSSGSPAVPAKSPEIRARQQGHAASRRAQVGAGAEDGSGDEAQTDGAGRAGGGFSLDPGTPQRTPPATDTSPTRPFGGSPVRPLDPYLEVAAGGGGGGSPADDEDERRSQPGATRRSGGRRGLASPPLRPPPSPLQRGGQQAVAAAAAAAAAGGWPAVPTRGRPSLDSQASEESVTTPRGASRLSLTPVASPSSSAAAAAARCGGAVDKGATPLLPAKSPAVLERQRVEKQRQAAAAAAAAVGWAGKALTSASASSSSSSSSPVITAATSSTAGGGVSMTFAAASTVGAAAAAAATPQAQSPEVLERQQSLRRESSVAATPLACTPGARLPGGGGGGGGEWVVEDSPVMSESPSLRGSSAGATGAGTGTRASNEGSKPPSGFEGFRGTYEIPANLEGVEIQPGPEGYIAKGASGAVHRAQWMGMRCAIKIFA
jgi:hypothetical protein